MQRIWEYVVSVAAAKIVGRAVRVPTRSLWLPLFSSLREGFLVLMGISPHDIAERFIKLDYYLSQPRIMQEQGVRSLRGNINRPTHNGTAAGLSRCVKEDRATASG